MNILRKRYVKVLKRRVMAAFLLAALFVSMSHVAVP